MPTRTILISVLVLLFTATAALGGVPYHDWSLSAGGTSDDNPTDADVDGYGNLYIVGTYRGSIDFGAGGLTSLGGPDVFLVKYAPDGTLLWSQSYGSANIDSPTNINVDQYGYVALTGYSWGSIDLGGGPLFNAGQEDIFVAKFAPDGAHIWSAMYGSAFMDRSFGVSLDNAGNVVVTGDFFSSSINLGGGVLTRAGLSDIFVAKYDASGAHVWSHQFGSTSRSVGMSVATDASGNVVVGTNGVGAIDYGGGPLTSLGSYDIHLVKLDPLGLHIWSKVLGSPDGDSVVEVDTDASGTVTLMAQCSGQPDFGGGSIPSNGGDDLYIARYDAAGNHLWSRGFGGATTEDPAGMDVSASGDITVCGRFEGVTDLGGGPLVSAGQRDIFVAQYMSGGTHKWSRRIGGSLWDYGSGVAVDAWGNVYLAALFNGALDAGGGPLFSAGFGDILVVRFLEGPGIHSVLDVPGDQGGRVNVAWDASTVDNATDRGITDYTVWRAIDAGAATAMLAEGAMLIDDPSGVKGVAKDVPVVRMEQSPAVQTRPAIDATKRGAGPETAPLYWYMVETVGAIGLANYSAPVPTLYDSTTASPQNHYFQVIAHTTDAFVYYTSAPDSGYSIDNLAPAAVQNLVAAQKATPAGLELKWDANSEADLSHYEIYRGTDQGFVADGGSFLTATPDTSSLDTDWQWDGGHYYKVFAVDTHGNKSPYALIGPNLVIGVGDTPGAAALDQNVPNPFNPTTTIGFTLVEGADVTLRIYDATGRLVRTLADGHRGASHHAVNWNGRDNAGNTVASGVYFYRLTAGAFTDTKKMVLLK